MTDPTTDSGLWATLGSVLGAGGVGAALAAWWKFRKDKRSDAADSANTSAQINMLEQAQRERDQAEKELTEERKERLAAERALTTAVADMRDAQRKIVARDKVIGFLRAKLKKAGVPDSDYVPLLETELGPLGPS